MEKKQKAVEDRMLDFGSFLREELDVENWAVIILDVDSGQTEQGEKFVQLKIAIPIEKDKLKLLKNITKESMERGYRSCLLLPCYRWGTKLSRILERETESGKYIA